MYLQVKDISILKKETMIFIFCNQCDGIIIIFWKHVYCLEMVSQVSNKAHGPRGGYVHVRVTFMEFLLLVSGLIFQN